MVILVLKVNYIKQIIGFKGQYLLKVINQIAIKLLVIKLSIHELKTAKNDFKLE